MSELKKWRGAITRQVGASLVALKQAGGALALVRGVPSPASGAPLPAKVAPAPAGGALPPVLGAHKPAGGAIIS